MIAVSPPYCTVTDLFRVYTCTVLQCRCMTLSTNQKDPFFCSIGSSRMFGHVTLSSNQKTPFGGPYNVPLSVWGYFMNYRFTLSGLYKICYSYTAPYNISVAISFFIVLFCIISMLSYFINFFPKT